MKLSLHEILKAERELAASRTAPKTQWERILVPIDFSDNSREALKLAVTLAADPEDRITLLHVVEADSWLHRGNAVMMTMSRSDEELKYEAGIRLQRWAAQEAGPDIKVETVVRTGKVHREILHVAKSLDSDVIVLATQPTSWLKCTVLGSVSRQLQRRAPCAVICIRPATVTSRPTIPVRFAPDESARRYRQIARRSIPVH